MNLTLEEEIKKLETNEIIPNIINSKPIKKLIVKYGIREIDIGDVLTPIAVKDKPIIEFEKHENDNDNDDLYTLILISVDEPSKSNRLDGEFKQWIVYNAKVNKFDKADELVQYIQPLPLIGTGLHRYIFILCKQPSKLDYKGELKIPFTIDDRKDWNSNSFIKKWNLKIEGINYFECQHDDSVDSINEKLVGSKEKSSII